MRSANQSIFATVRGPTVERSKNMRPSTLKTTLNPDYIYPIYVDDVLPGDTRHITVHNMIRMSNPLKSVPMDNVYVDLFAFFVPTRIIFKHFVNMMGEQDSPDDPTDYTYPKINMYVGYNTGAGYIHKFPTGSLFDYLGLPTLVDFPHAALADNFINACQARCYNLIFHKWFRDQNLIDSPYITDGDGPDPLGTVTAIPGGSDYGEDETTNYRLRKRAKNRDYFTSCLLTPQKGPDVEIPIGSTAPVYGDGYTVNWYDGANQAGTVSGNTTTPQWVTQERSNKGQTPGTARSDVLGGLAIDKVIGVSTSAQLTAAGITHSGLYADLEEATATTINEFRLLFAKQRYFERLNRGGSRYKEVTQSFFGVSLPDFRAQWPELLGISSQKISSAEIMQSSGTGASGTTTALGQLAAQYKSSNSRKLISKSFVEHGYIMILANIRADLTYWQGIPRQFLKSTVWDEFWPQFGHIGEQAVYNMELYYKGNAVYDSAVFGYQQAWSWLKYKNNQITGQMRPNASTNFKQWHLAQELNEPALDEDFITSAVPIERVSSSILADYFLADFLFDEVAIRPVPFNTDPGLLDHF